MEKRSEESQHKERELVNSRPPSPSLPYPWLIFFDGKDDSRHTFYSIADNRFHIRFIPELRNKSIISCYKGWCFLEDIVTYDFSLLNMLTMEKLELPPLNSTYLRNWVMSSPPLDGSCRIITIMGNMIKFRSCYVGDSKFVEQRLDYESCGHIAVAINYKEKLYALTSPAYNLLVADFADPELYFRRVITGEALYPTLVLTSLSEFYLVESLGELLFIHTCRYDHDGLDIKIFKADFNNREWVVVKHLGDRVIFLDRYKGLSSQACQFGLRGNSVYYVDDCNRNLYTYDLEDRSISMSMPCPIVSSTQLSPFWAI